MTIFIKSYNEKSNEGYFLEIDIQYSEKVYEWFTVFTEIVLLK